MTAFMKFLSGSCARRRPGGLFFGDFTGGFLSSLFLGKVSGSNSTLESNFNTKNTIEQNMVF